MFEACFFVIWLHQISHTHCGLSYRYIICCFAKIQFNPLIFALIFKLVTKI